MSKELSKFSKVTLLEPSPKFRKIFCIEEGNFKHIFIPQRRSFSGFLISSIKRILYSLTEDYDIIYCIKALPTACFCGLVAKYLRKKKFVLDWDDYEAGYLKAIEVNENLKLFLKIFERIIIHHADLLTLHSENLKRLAILFGVNKNKIHKINQGVDIKLFNPRRKPKKLGFGNKKILGYVATLSPTSDLDKILDIFAEVQKENKEVILLVVGGGPKEKFFKDYAKQKGVREKTIFIGKVDYESVPEYIKAADICLMYLRDNISNKTRSPLKLLEYWAMEKIVISTKVGEVNYVSKCGKDILLAENDEEYKNLILFALKNKKKLSYLGKNGRKKVERYFVWSKSAKKLNKIFKGML